MSLKSESEWLACKPLATANLPSWVRAIQADALDYAANKVLLSPWTAEAVRELKHTSHQLLSKRDDFTNQPAPDKDRLFHELVVVVTGMRACLRDVIEDSDGQLVSREIARVEEADALLKACESHTPKIEQLKEWEKEKGLTCRETN